MRGKAILYIDSARGYFGGGQVSLLETAKRISLQSNGEFYPIVIINDEEGEFSRRLKESSIEFYKIDQPALLKSSPLAVLRAIHKLRAFIKSRNNDICIIHANTSRAALYSSYLSLSDGVSLVWHVRIPHRDPLPDKILYKFSTKIIAVSKAVAENRFSAGGFRREKIHIIYNGVEVPAVDDTGLKRDDTLRKFYGFEKDDIVIGVIGRISPEKGIEHLLNAIFSARGLADNPKVRLFIVGEGLPDYVASIKALAARLNTAVSKNKTEKVVFGGFVSDILRALSVCDIFCLPSLTEGFNRTLLEAMATGRLPVVATSVGGNPEAVSGGENGILVPPSNPDALAKAILYLIDNPSNARIMAEKARVTVEEKFNIQKNVSLTIELYRQILNKN